MKEKARGGEASIHRGGGGGFFVVFGVGLVGSFTTYRKPFYMTETAARRTKVTVGKRQKGWDGLPGLSIAAAAEGPFTEVSGTNRRRQHLTRKRTSLLQGVSRKNKHGVPSERQIVGLEPPKDEISTGHRETGTRRAIRTCQETRVREKRKSRPS